MAGRRTIENKLDRDFNPFLAVHHVSFNLRGKMKKLEFINMFERQMEQYLMKMDTHDGVIAQKVLLDFLAELDWSMFAKSVIVQHE